jgi:hypothetical protein
MAVNELSTRLDVIIGGVLQRKRVEGLCVIFEPLDANCFDMSESFPEYSEEDFIVIAASQPFSIRSFVIPSARLDRTQPQPVEHLFVLKSEIDKNRFLSLLALASKANSRPERKRSHY